ATSPPYLSVTCASSGRLRAPHPVPTRRSSDLFHSLHRTATRCSPDRHGSTPAHPATSTLSNSTVTPTSTNRSANSRKPPRMPQRSEEHTSELQSRENLVCRLLLEKKNALAH